MAKPKKQDLVRTNVFLSRTALLNLDAYAVMTQQSSANVIREAIDQLLKSKGLQPDKVPELRVSYD